MNNTDDPNHPKQQAAMAMSPQTLKHKGNAEQRDPMKNGGNDANEDPREEGEKRLKNVVVSKEGNGSPQVDDKPIEREPSSNISEERFFKEKGEVVVATKEKSNSDTEKEMTTTTRIVGNVKKADENACEQTKEEKSIENHESVAGEVPAGVIDAKNDEVVDEVESVGDAAVGHAKLVSDTIESETADDGHVSEYNGSEPKSTEDGRILLAIGEETANSIDAKKNGSTVIDDDPKTARNESTPNSSIELKMSDNIVEAWGEDGPLDILYGNTSPSPSEEETNEKANEPLSDAVLVPSPFSSMQVDRKNQHKRQRRRMEERLKMKARQESRRRRENKLNSTNKKAAAGANPLVGDNESVAITTVCSKNSSSSILDEDEALDGIDELHDCSDDDPQKKAKAKENLSEFSRTTTRQFYSRWPLQCLVGAVFIFVFLFVMGITNKMDRDKNETPSFTEENKPKFEGDDTNSQDPSGNITISMYPTESPQSSQTGFSSSSQDTSIDNDPTRAPTEFPTINNDSSRTPQTGSSQDTSIDNDQSTRAPTEFPTISNDPTRAPTEFPSIGNAPTRTPTEFPTNQPSDEPTRFPTSVPSENPSSVPTSNPTKLPSFSPTTDPFTPITEIMTNLTYRPGNLTTYQAGLLLSEGLAAKEIATKDENVKYANGEQSTISFHHFPDGGETFPDPREDNDGGWIYVSNSERPEFWSGGVGAITFDKNGNVLDYRMILERTTMNCGGGATPWNTWVSCEELDEYGQIYQVDPTGRRPAQIMPMGTVGSGRGENSLGGRYEAFTYDDRNRTHPKYFVSEDHNRGPVRRFTPSPEVVDWDNPWDMLHDENGITEFLILHPEREHEDSTIYGGTFEWTTDLQTARISAETYYPQTEGIDRHEGQLFFVCKNIRQLFTVNLDEGTYTNSSTITGLFDGKPDQIQQILDDPNDTLYFTEEGGVDAGVHARDSTGGFYTILESPDYVDETSGLAFSPDGKHMYIAYQHNGKLFDVWRQDGLPFNARRLDVKYHAIGGG